MFKLIHFEWRKLFLKRSIIIAVLIFSIINIVKIDSVYKQKSLFAADSTPVWQDVYWQVYNDFKGNMTNEKIDKLLSIYRPLEQKTADHTASTAMNNPNTYTGNVYSDYYLFGWCYVQPMEYFYMYQNTADSIVGKSAENMDFFKSIGNTYEYRKNAEIAKLFANRKISDFSYTEMYKNYVHYDFSVFLVLLICLYGLVNVFVSEKETDMDELLLTTTSGGTRTVAAKIISSAIFIAVVCIWFWLLDFITFSIVFHSLEAAFLPVYAIQNFLNASVNINLWQYAVLSGAVKTVGMIVLGMAFLFISCFFKNALLPFIVNLFLGFGLIYLQEMYMGSGYILLKVINPVVLLANRELFRNTEFVNFGGYPVLSYISAIVFALAWGTLFIVLICNMVKKNAICRKRRSSVCK